MKKTIMFFIFLSLTFVFLNGCNSSQSDKDLFEFKDSYIGDNSAVGNIVKQLAYGEHLDRFELQTDDEPFGMILYYKGLESEERYKETAIYNATFIFALVQNAEWITFNFEQQEYQLTKDALENWYGEELSDYSNEDDLRELAGKYLDDQRKINDLLN